MLLIFFNWQYFIIFSYIFSYKLNEYQKAILIIRHPLEAYMSAFSHGLVTQTTYLDLEIFEATNFSQRFLEEGLPTWKHFHDTILEDYVQPLHFVPYEKLKTNLIEEMRRILIFLGFNLTKEVESCLRLDFEGKFKRKKRPQEELYSIYENFTNTQLEQFDAIYEKYLQRFQTKITS